MHLLDTATKTKTCHIRTLPSMFYDIPCLTKSPLPSMKGISMESTLKDIAHILKEQLSRGLLPHVRDQSTILEIPQNRVSSLT